MMSRSVMMPSRRSPSITSSEPVCCAHIAAAAALIDSDGDSVMLALVMTSLTYIGGSFASHDTLPRTRTLRATPAHSDDQPPSEAIVWPVIQAASSLSRNATSRAASSGVLQRPPGLRATTASYVAWSAHPVSLGPGLHAVDRDRARCQVDREAGGELVQGRLARDVRELRPASPRGTGPT